MSCRCNETCFTTYSYDDIAISNGNGFTEQVLFVRKRPVEFQRVVVAKKDVFDGLFGMQGNVLGLLDFLQVALGSEQLYPQGLDVVGGGDVNQATDA